MLLTLSNLLEVTHINKYLLGTHNEERNFKFHNLIWQFISCHQDSLFLSLSNVLRLTLGTD